MWIHLIINLINNDKNNVSVYSYVNGENSIIQFSIKKARLTNIEVGNSIKFFNNFYFEVSLITYLIQKDYGYSGVNVTFSRKPVKIERIWKFWKSIKLIINW